MHIEDIQEYIEIFNEEKNMLTDAYALKTIVFDLEENEIIDYLTKYADTLKFDKTEQSSQGIAIIMYGYRAGIIELKNEPVLMTHQSGYVNTPLWSSGSALDEMLNKESAYDEENQEADNSVSVSNLVEWIINPEGNIEIRDGILGKMVLPMVKEMGKNIPPGKRGDFTVIIPPVSNQISFPDWQKFFSNIKSKYLNVRIVDYSEMLNIQKDERVYFCIHQTDGFREFIIVSAYEIIRGQKSCVGSIAFDITNDEQYEMENVHELQFEIDNSNRELDRKAKELLSIKSDWKYVGLKCPQLSGFKAFMGSVSPTFMNEMYIKTEKVPQKSGAAALCKTFRGSEALQVAEICSRFLGEKNLNQIALGDMVYVADILNKDNSFNTALIKQNRKDALGTLSEIGNDIDLSRLAEIPSNFANFTWRVKKTAHVLVPYFELDKDKNSIKQIIESTVDHYAHCTTAQVAEDIMYLYNDKEPNAFFTAKVFMILSAMDTLIIDSKDEVIESIQNVDEVEFTAIGEKEKAQIKKQNTPVKKTTTPQSTIFKSKITPKENARKMTIEQAEFSVRTYNCLRRAGIRTIGELANKTPEQLLKVRNLGRNGINEINNKLRKLGVK